MTILALFFFVIIVGLGGLGIDIGRLYGLHGQMVAYVDQVALASAAELDRQTGAIARATRAAIGDDSGGPLISTTYNFSNAGTALGVYNLIFLSHIADGPGPTPQADDTVVCTYQSGAWAPTACNNDSAIDRQAQFVAVTSVPLTISYLVLPIANFFLGPNAIADTASLQMQATAGYKQVTCDITPLMICSPDEPSGNTNTLYPYTPDVGQQILMKASGSGAAWQPGDFGLLSEPSSAGGAGCKGSGASFTSCVLALVKPLTQCIQNTVNVEPGQEENTSDGINTRFDIYVQSAGKYAGVAGFEASANVTKGIIGKGGNACPNNYLPSSASLPLPRDANMKADTTGTVRFGTGVSYSDIQAYWAANHPGVTMPAAIQTACQGSGYACRYTIYRYEIDNNMVPDISGDENGNPMCTQSKGLTPVNNPNYDRRTLIMAVVNCNAAGLHGNTSNSGTYSGIPVVSYVKMFLTEPIGLTEDTNGKVTGLSGSSNNIYGEVVGVVKPGDQSGIIHVLPVLYR